MRKSFYFVSTTTLTSYIYFSLGVCENYKTDQTLNLIHLCRIQAIIAWDFKIYMNHTITYILVCSLISWLVDWNEGLAEDTCHRLRRQVKVNIISDHFGVAHVHQWAELQVVLSHLYYWENVWKHFIYLFTIMLFFKFDFNSTLRFRVLHYI